MKVVGKLRITGVDPKMGFVEGEIEMENLRSNKRIQINVSDPLSLQKEGTITIEIQELRASRK